MDTEREAGPLGLRRWNLSVGNLPFWGDRRLGSGMGRSIFGDDRRIASLCAKEGFDDDIRSILRVRRIVGRSWHIRIGPLEAGDVNEACTRIEAAQFL